MTPLHQQMIRQMELKNFSPHTQRSYINAVNGLATCYRRSPETITGKMVEDYLLYLKKAMPRPVAAWLCPVFAFSSDTSWTNRLRSVFD